MRTPESPKWGTRVVERWVKETTVRMKRGEVCRVTFEGVWRGGVKRRLLTNDQATMHLAACKHAMKLGQSWDPPPDRIQARLWNSDKRYLASLTWQIGARPHPRPLERGELPQKQTASSSKGAGSSSQVSAAVGAETVAFRSAIEKRISQLEETMKSAPPTDQLDVLHRRLAEVEAENQRLREGLEVVWKELSEPVLLDVYQRLQKLYREQELNWAYPIRPLVLPEKWPNITSD